MQSYHNYLNLILSIFFGPENVVCLLHLLHIIKRTLEYFIMVANIMNPEQTAPEGAV